MTEPLTDARLAEIARLSREDIGDYDFQPSVREMLSHIDALTAHIAELEDDIVEGDKHFKKLSDEFEDLTARIAELTKDRDKWKFCVERFEEQRDAAITERDIAQECHEHALALAKKEIARVRAAEAQLETAEAKLAEAERERNIWAHARWASLENWKARGLAAEAQLETARRDVLERAATAIENMRLVPNEGSAPHEVWLHGFDMAKLGASDICRALQPQQEEQSK